MSDVTKLPMFTNPKIYDLVYSECPRGKSKYQLEVKFIERLVYINKLKKNILDIGCGTGTHLIELAKKGFSGVGIDLNSLMLDRTRSKSKKFPIEYQKGDMRNFKLGRKFPIVTCLYGAFHYLPDEESAEQAVKTFYEHTEEGGIFIADIKTSKIRNGVNETLRGDGIKIITSWELDKKDLNNRTAFYNAAIFKPGRDGFLTYESHHVKFMDPFYIGRKMKKAGFKEVKIFDNFNLDHEVFENCTSYRTVIVAKK